MIPRDIKATRGKITGSTPDDIQYESVLEENFLFLLRFDPKVERIDRCRDSITWIDKDGREREYLPDFEVVYRDETAGSKRRHFVYEVKPDLEPNPYSRRSNLQRREDPAENSLKWRSAEAWLKARRKTFKVIRSSEIETPTLDNAKFLLPYLEQHPRHSECALVLDVLHQGGAASIREIMAKLTSDRTRRAELLPACYQLIAKRQVHADLDTALTLDSVVSLQ